MKKIISLLLTIALLCVAISTLVIIFSYLRPRTTTERLLIWFTSAEYAADVIFVCSFVAAFVASLVPYIRRKLPKRKIRNDGRPLSWFIRVCQVIAVIAVLEFILSDPRGVHLEDGKWMTGGSHAQHVELTQQEAYEFLWQGLRKFAALALFVGTVWVMFACALLRNESESKKGAEP